MALPLSGHKDRELLQVETEGVALLIKGKPMHPTARELNLNQDEQGNWQQAAINVVSYVGDYKAFVFDPFEDADNNNLRDYVPGNLCFPCFYENQNYNIVVRGKEGSKLSFYHENKHLRDAITPFDDNLLSGNINFSSDIGFSELVVRNHGRDVLKIQLEVFPAKLDYKKDYQVLLQEVNNEVYNLAYDYLRKTYFSAKLKPNVKASLNEFFNIINIIFTQLVKSLERIKLNPHHKIASVEDINRIEKIKKFNAQSTKWLSLHPELLIPQTEQRGIKVNENYYMPQRMREAKRVITYDTFENRFIKWVISKVIKQLNTFLQEYLKVNSRDSSRYDEEIERRISRMQSILQRQLASEYLQDVGNLNQLNNLSLVLQMAPGYREVYRYYLMLTKGLSIQRDVFKVSIKELWQLYEYWCFLALNRLLREKYDLVSQDLIKVTNNGLVVKLKKNKTTTMNYINPRNGECFNISYQDFNEGPTMNQEPDNMLTLHKSDSKIAYKYVLDAKYRINPAVDSHYRNKYGKPGPEESDINTMHRYRDAIVFNSKDKGYEKKVYGAFVLFPYGDSDLYSGKLDGNPHDFYKSIEKVNIGALPFLPGNTELVEKFLDEIISDTSETAVEKVIFHEGLEKYYYEKYLKKNVLVGSLRNKEQWHKNYDHRFYHIPLNKVIGVLDNLKYVAIYKSKKLFGDECGVTHYGKIVSYKILPRDEIVEISSYKMDKYVRFEIEQWSELPNLIKPLNYGIYDRMFTTLPLLLNAEELPELKLESEEELRLWKELTRHSQNVQAVGSQVQLDDAQVKEIRIANGLIKIDNHNFTCEADERVLVIAIEELKLRKLELFKEIKEFFNQ